MKQGSIWMFFGGLLLFGAAVLTIYNINEADEAWEQSHQAAQVLQEEIVEFQEIVVNDVPDYQVVPDMEMPAIEIDGERYVGMLSIPALELELPIIEEWTDAGLKKAPCRYGGSVYADNLVIVGHNYRKHFSKLKTLETGTEINFTDADGNLFQYTIGWVEVLEENDISGMTDASEWDLTLFTCTYGGKERYTVRCIRTEEI